MRYVVHRRFIDEDEVLVGAAAAHEKGRGALAGAGDARQHLYRFDDIGLSQQGGQFFDLLDGHVDAAHGYLLDGVVRFFVRHHNFFQHRRSGLHLGVEFDISPEGDRLHHSLVTHIGEGQFISARRQGQRVETVQVSGSARLGGGFVNTSVEQFFAGSGVLEVATDGKTFFFGCVGLACCGA